MEIKEIDKVEITCLVDDHANLLLPSTPIAQRPPLRESWFEKPPIGVHGFSVALELSINKTRHVVLFDSGLSSWALTYNVDAIDFDISSCGLVILSHGHIDHAGGLLEIRKKMNGRNIPLVVHKDAFKKRLFKFESGTINLPPPDKSALIKADYEIVENNKSSMWMDNHILVTGEIPRTNDFEKGLPNHFSDENGKIEHEPLINDDQAIVLNVKKKGLVIITGCAHSGIINTINYVKKITGKDNIYAILGGMHLEGMFFEPIISKTIEQLQKNKPKFIIPCHCTGFNATNEIAKKMPDVVIPNSVGTTYVL